MSAWTVVRENWYMFVAAFVLIGVICAAGDAWVNRRGRS